MNFAKMDLGYILGHILGHILPNAFGRPARYVFTFLLQNCIGFVKLLFLNYFRLARFFLVQHTKIVKIFQIISKDTKIVKNIPNYLKRYQMAIKNIKLSQKIPNGHKVYQIISKDTKWP
jgi:arginine/lysine/ornithine decarboxylase